MLSINMKRILSILIVVISLYVLFKFGYNYTKRHLEINNIEKKG